MDLNGPNPDWNDGKVDDPAAIWIGPIFFLFCLLVIGTFCLLEKLGY